MEVYTFIHKETKDIIRVYLTYGDDEFNDKYCFTKYSFGIPWFVFTKEELDFIIENKNFMHPQYSGSYNKPSSENVNIDDYEPSKFILSDEKI